MRRAAVKIPNEALDRTIEYLGSDLRTRLLKFEAHVGLKLRNLSSNLHQSYHFDSVREFLQFQWILQPDSDRVAFGDVAVSGKDYRGHLLELRISDDTGEARLIYPCSRRYHVTYDPVHGSIIGDRIQVFDSLYISEGALLLPRAWFIKNDYHYRRIREN